MRPAHLPARGTRGSTAHRANPLMGPGLPIRRTADPRELRAIVDYLDVERSPRYRPAGGQTFCNVYAFDYCYLAGVYLPRVWWNTTHDMERGIGVWGDTVHEVNANGLHDWLKRWGVSGFAWRRVDSLTDLCDAANSGSVAVITAKRKDPQRSGHISCVLPDAVNSSFPLQSQAGARNFNASIEPGRWWEWSQFSEHGFWFNPEVATSRSF